MKISVIMVDGSFRENIFGAQFFTSQNFPTDEYEVFWIEFYATANPALDQYISSGLKIITLDNASETTYHSSHCFNEGIQRASGEVVIIPDADQIVEPGFLSKVWDWHKQNEDLVVYGYRHEETIPKSIINYNDFNDVVERCHLKNITNYGGCLTVRRKWLLEINGYEQHWFFQTGFHANGTDVYHRLKNLGLKIIWDKNMRLYHPWHPLTQVPLNEKEFYQLQFHLIQWRARNLESKPFEGINPDKNSRLKFPFDGDEIEQIRQTTAPADPPTGFKAGLYNMFPGLMSTLSKIKVKLTGL